MNESGIAIEKIREFYKIPTENIIVIFDDIDLPEGTVKIRKKGGPGTHNGMRSVTKELNSTNFPRVRIGTGMPIFKELLVNYVIEPLNDEKYNKLVPAIEKASEATIAIVTKGVDLAMNLYN